MDFREKLKQDRRARPVQELTAQDYSSTDFLVQTAGLFDVYKYSDYPEVNLVIDDLFEQIRLLRKSKNKQIRYADKVKKHLKVAVIDLWAGHRLGPNPYHGISMNKSDYQKGDRYRKIFLKYDFLIPVINDLSELGYIALITGSLKNGIRTRIKATDKLINLILNPRFGVDKVVALKGNIAIVQTHPKINEELIRLKSPKDEKGNAKLIEYKDNEATNKMRENLMRINDKIANSRVTLRITDEQFAALEEQIKRKTDLTKRSINFSNIRLHRTFNNASFDQGGRFYGGWWQNIPRDFRKYIEINHKPTVELDYSGHHFRLMYAMNDLEPPENPYDLKGFDRDLQKEAAFIIINSSSRRKAIIAIKEVVGITNSALFVKQFSERHQAISKHFFTGEGIRLMHQDSQLAEAVMLEMLKRNATILPVHDSFIVRNSYDQELEEVMNAEFTRMFGKQAKLSFKRTVLEDDAARRLESGESETFTTTDLAEIAANLGEFSIHKRIWGFE